jgi:hypothetical protein
VAASAPPWQLTYLTWGLTLPAAANSRLPEQLDRLANVYGQVTGRFSTSSIRWNPRGA